MDIIQLTEVMGNVGEFVGSFAVLATLIYLAVQVKQSKGLLEINQRIALHDGEYKRAQLRVDLAFKAAELSDVLVNQPFQKSAPEATAIIKEMSVQDQSKLLQWLVASLAVARFAVNSERLGLLTSDLENLKNQLTRTVPIAREFGIHIPTEIEDFMRDAETMA